MTNMKLLKLNKLNKISEEQKYRNVVEIVLTLDIMFVAVAMQIKEFLFFYLQSNK